MFGAVKLLWNWGAKWFDRYEFLDFVTNKLGLTSVVTKILPAGGAVVMALVAYVGRAPWYIILLAALCAVVLILTGIRLTQIILKEESKSGKSKITETVPRRKSAVPKNIPAGTPSSSVSILQSNIGGFLAIAAAVIIASVGTTLYNNWTTYKEKLDQTSLVVIPIPHPPVPDHNQSFGVDLHWGDSGPLRVQGIRREHHFEYPKQEMSKSDIDKQYLQLSAALSQQEVSLLDELRPGAPGEFRTIEDQRFTEADWKNVLNGSLIAYVFAEFRYLVDDTTKDTEVCIFITSDYPSIHKCPGHNRTFISQ